MISSVSQNLKIVIICKNLKKINNTIYDGAFAFQQWQKQQ